jgi:hypothetical protein
MTTKICFIAFIILTCILTLMNYSPKKELVTKQDLRIQYLGATNIRDLCALGIDARADYIQDDTSNQIIKLLVTNK